MYKDSGSIFSTQITKKKKNYWLHNCQLFLDSSGNWFLHVCENVPVLCLHVCVFVCASCVCVCLYMQGRTVHMYGEQRLTLSSFSKDGTLFFRRGLSLNVGHRVLARAGQGVPRTLLSLSSQCWGHRCASLCLTLLAASVPKLWAFGGYEQALWIFTVKSSTGHHRAPWHETKLLQCELHRLFPSRTEAEKWTPLSFHLLQEIKSSFSRTGDGD